MTYIYRVPVFLLLYTKQTITTNNITKRTIINTTIATTMLGKLLEELADAVIYK